MVITLCVIWIIFLIKIFERILCELNVYLLYLNLFCFFVFLKPGGVGIVCWILVCNSVVMRAKRLLAISSSKSM